MMKALVFVEKGIKDLTEHLVVMSISHPHVLTFTLNQMRMKNNYLQLLAKIKIKVLSKLYENLFGY